MSIARPIGTSLIVGLLLCQIQPANAQNSKENADFKLAINLYNDAIYDLAAEQLKQFIGSFSNTSNGIEARFYLGLTQMKLRQFDDARLTFQTFALSYQDNPKAPEAWLNVGECYVAMKSYKEAALAFERVKVFHAKSKVAPEALVKAGKYFKLAGQPDDARRVLRTTLQEYGNSNSSLSARALLGQMYFEEGNLPQAQNELKRVIDEDPAPDAKAQALLILGGVHQAMGQTIQAQSDYQEIITKYQSSSVVQGAYLNLGKLQSTSGNFSEAIESFKKALLEKNQIDSSLMYETFAGMGNGYAAMGETGNALTQYGKATAYASSPEEATSILWKIAVTAARGKNWSRSTDACNRLLKSNTTEAVKTKAAIRLALNAEAQKDYAQAVQYFTAFLDQHPSDPAADDIAFRIASLTEKEMNDTRKAASTYDQFITRYLRSPWIDDAYAGAARCYSDLKEFERAAQLYRELLARFPSSEFANTAEERLREIQIFEVKEKDAGVEKLALLLGDVVSDRDKVGLSYRLGEIYFKDLKNYPAAAEQFTNAINSGMKGERFADALYYRARSFEYMSSKDPKYIPRAIESYRTFLTSYASDSRGNDATLSLFLLSATSLDSARVSYDASLASLPTFTKQDVMLQRIGILQEKADSLEAALSTFGTIMREFGDSPTRVEAAYRRIPLLLSLGLTDSAIHESVTYLATFPNGRHNAEVMSRLADLLVKSSDQSRGATYYQQLRDNFFYTSFAREARSKLADTYTATGQYDAAISIYSELITEQSDNPLLEKNIDASLLLSIGKTHQLAGNNAEAKKYLLQVLVHEQSGDIAGAAYNTLGLIARSEGNAELATSYFRQAGNVAPHSSTSRDVADLLFENGAYIDAIKQYTSLSEAATGDSGRQYFDSRIIIARYRNDDLANAERDRALFLKKYDNAGDDVAAFELEKGLYYYRKEEYVNARKSFDRIVDKSDETPSAPYAMYWIGKILEATQQQQEALNQYEKLKKNYPASTVIPRVQLALGNIAYNMEKWDESARNYKLIIDDPNADPSLLPIAMSNLIETYETAGVFDAALQLTRKYLESYPNADDSFDKKIKIGILYQRLGYNDQSVLHLQTLLDQAGSDLEGEIRYYIAEANYNKGDYQQAILDFLKVPYLVTKKGKLDWTANSLYMAGQSYEKLGRFDQALTMYQQITSRQGIDETFKAAAKKEIERVKLVLKKPGSK